MAFYRFILRLSLKWRLTLLFTSGMAALLVILSIFVYLGTSRVVYQHEQRLLQQKTKAIAADLTTEIVEESSLTKEYLTRLLNNYSDINLAILLLDSHGNKLASVVGSGWKNDPWESGESMLVARQEVHFSATSAPFLIELMQRTEPLQGFFRVLLLTLSLGSLAALAFAGFGGYILTRLGLKPLNRVIVHIREMNAARLSARLPTYDVAYELRELVTAFNSLLDQVEETLKHQQQFVADASHELRTPLAIINGYIRLLQRWGKDKPEVREEAIVAIQQECKRLFRLIEDLLSLAKMQRASFALEQQEMQSLVPLLKEVKHAWASLFPQSIELIVTWEEPLMLFMDRGRIRQLLDILLDNARKYTEKGYVSVFAHTEGDHVHIHVKDTGIGIPQEELPHIFRRFYRVEKSRNRDKGGSGLGLAIAQSIVKAHHGTITIQRAPSGGTHVYIRLPNQSGR